MALWPWSANGPFLVTEYDIQANHDEKGGDGTCFMLLPGYRPVRILGVLDQEHGAIDSRVYTAVKRLIILKALERTEIFEIES